MIEVAELTVKLVAARRAEVDRASLRVKPVPVMVTAVPPRVGPAVGLTAVTVGAASIGELVGGRVGDRGATGCGHGDVDRARRPRRGRWQ